MKYLPDLIILSKELVSLKPEPVIKQTIFSWGLIWLVLTALMRPLTDIALEGSQKIPSLEARICWIWKVNSSETKCPKPLWAFNLARTSQPSTMEGTCNPLILVSLFLIIFPS